LAQDITKKYGLSDDTVKGAHLNLPGRRLEIKSSGNGADSSALDRGWARMYAKHGEETPQYLIEQLKHNIPKVFFFLIPFLALMLKVLFLRRKEALFVHHAVFSLHMHSFYFSMLIIPLLNPFAALSFVLGFGVLAGGVTYCAVSMKRVYQTSTG